MLGSQGAPGLHLRTLLLLLVLLVVVGGGIYLAREFIGSSSVQQEQENLLRTGLPQGFPQDAPLPKKEDTVAMQTPFQYLVMFTDRGFTPATLTASVGETIRFTNTSPLLLRVSVGEAGSPTLNHGEYWQYTIESAGTIEYRNLEDSVTGRITAQ